jgi:type VI secretion system protein ImpE
MTPGELFKAGRLGDAIAASVEAVKARPADPAPRYLLAELLCFAGEYERADTHLDVVLTQRSELQLTVSLFKQLIRADQSRQQFFAEGRPPGLLAPADDAMTRRIAASISFRTGNLAEATKLLAEAEELRPACPGVVDGEAFQDVRDLDDLLSGVVEMLTPTGKYFLVPSEMIESIEFRKPESPRDLLWRGAQVSVRAGPEGEVFIPALYPGASKCTDEALKLGRATDWVGSDQQAVRGVGQRLLAFDGRDRAILTINTITFGQG